MMCKAKHLLWLVALACVLLWPKAAMADVTRLLVITDEQVSDTSAAMTAVVRQIALYSNWECSFVEAREVAETKGYTGIILALDARGEMPEQAAALLAHSDLPIFVIGQGGIAEIADTQLYQGSMTMRLTTQGNEQNDSLLRATKLLLMQGEGEKLGGTLFVGGQELPLCQSMGRITHLCYFAPEKEAECAFLATMLQEWLWPYENDPVAYGDYLVLDMAYPFTDPESLLERVDMLEEENVPYSIAVMPMYANAEYPAMKRFCEVLRYAQSKGASILMHVPLVVLQNVEVDDLKTNIATAYSAYSRYGVYPLAIVAPDVWLMSEKGQEVLRGWRTVFMFTSDEAVYGTRLKENTALRDGHQLIAPAYQQADAYTSAYPQAIYIDVATDTETIRTQVQRLKNSRFVLKDVRDMENVVYAGNMYVHYLPDEGMMVDGSRVSLAYTRFTYEDNFVYDRGFMQHMVEQIQSSNKLIMAFVAIACTFFSVGMVLSRRDTRRQLLGLGKKKETQCEEVEIDDAG